MKQLDSRFLTRLVPVKKIGQRVMLAGSAAVLVAGVSFGGMATPAFATGNDDLGNVSLGGIEEVNNAGATANEGNTPAADETATEDKETTGEGSADETATGRESTLVEGEATSDDKKAAEEKSEEKAEDKTEVEKNQDVPYVAPTTPVPGPDAWEGKNFDGRIFTTDVLVDITAEKDGKTDTQNAGVYEVKNGDTFTFHAAMDASTVPHEVQQNEEQTLSKYGMYLTFLGYDKNEAYEMLMKSMTVKDITSNFLTVMEVPAELIFPSTTEPGAYTLYSKDNLFHIPAGGVTASKDGKTVYVQMTLNDTFTKPNEPLLYKTFVDALNVMKNNSFILNVKGVKVQSPGEATFTARGKVTGYFTGTAVVDTSKMGLKPRDLRLINRMFPGGIIERSFTFKWSGVQDRNINAYDRTNAMGTDGLDSTLKNADDEAKKIISFTLHTPAPKPTNPDGPVIPSFPGTDPQPPANNDQPGNGGNEKPDYSKGIPVVPVANETQRPTQPGIDPLQPGGLPIAGEHATPQGVPAGVPVAGENAAPTLAKTGSDVTVAGAGALAMLLAGAASLLAVRRLGRKTR